MSTDSHDQTRSCKTPVRSEEESAFDGKRIKKEYSDTCVENGDTASATASATAVVEKRQQSTLPSPPPPPPPPPAVVPAGRFVSNGFHEDNGPLQDIVATKFATLANHSTSKQDKFRIMIEDGIRLSRFSFWINFPTIASFFFMLLLHIGFPCPHVVFNITSTMLTYLIHHGIIYVSFVPLLYRSEVFLQLSLDTFAKVQHYLNACLKFRILPLVQLLLFHYTADLILLIPRSKILLKFLYCV